MERLNFDSEEFTTLLTQTLGLHKGEDCVESSVTENPAPIGFSRDGTGIRGKAYYSDSEEECGEESFQKRVDPEKIDPIQMSSDKRELVEENKRCDNEERKNVRKTRTKVKAMTLGLRSPPKSTIVLSSSEQTRMVKTLTVPTTILNISLETYVSSSPSTFVPTYHNDPDDSDPLKPLKALKELSQSLCMTQPRQQNPKYTIIILLQSGRFAAAIFCRSKCIQHTTKVRYTTRKGQGGAQSTKDGTKSISSVGSQLRRAGEVQLRSDIQNTFLQWGREGLLQNCGLGFLQISKLLQKGFWEDVMGAKQTLQQEGHLKNQEEEQWILHKDSVMIRPIPLDVGKPCIETCCAVHETMFSCSIEDIALEEIVLEQEKSCEDFAEEKSGSAGSHSDTAISQNQTHSTELKSSPVAKKESSTIPLSSLHTAAEQGNLNLLRTILETPSKDLVEVDQIHPDINTHAGPLLMTPLHFATQADTQAAQCVSILLQHHADPTRTDAHNRPPYYLASNEPIRRSYRRARADLGELKWDWVAAKVGPAMEAEDVDEKRRKRAEKKKRQKERQKEAKRKEKEDALEAEREEKIKKDIREKEDAARRIRAGLEPRKAGKANRAICDYCQTECKRKSEMFSRLDFKYCSTECVKKHQRELSAAAAMARFSS